MIRLFVPPEDWTDGEIPLSESESKHAIQVLRLGVGGRVLVFDGVGRYANAEVSKVGKREARVRVLTSGRVERPRPGLHLIMALIKGERFDRAVEKATELGVASIRPVSAERSVVQIGGRDAEKKRRGWMQTAITAAKQCGHLVLPEIYPACAAAQAFRAAPAGRRGIPALYPEGVTLGKFLADTGGDVTFAIGPEGDWTLGEMAAARAEGFVPLDLGLHVLRSETAALYVLSATSHQILGGAGGSKASP